MLEDSVLERMMETLKPLYYAMSYRNTRSLISESLGIKVCNSPGRDIKEIEKYCLAEGLDFKERLREVTGRKSPLGHYPGSSPASDDSVNLILFKFFQKATEKVRYDVNLAAIDQKDQIEEPHIEDEQYALDQLLRAFESEREWVSNFECKAMDDIDFPFDKLEQLNSEGVLVYRPSDQSHYKRIVGDVVFVPMDHGGQWVEQRFFSDFCQELIGSDNIASPITTIGGKYRVMLRESADHECFIKDPNVDDYDKFKSIAEHLMKQCLLEDVQGDHLNNLDGSLKLGMNIFVGMRDVKLMVGIERFDYADEIMRSAILGRPGEINRLACVDEVIEDDGVRRYKCGSNPSLEGLIDATDRFVESYLDPPELRFLHGVTNLDAQPSNYFINGKINDLDRIAYGNSMYMVARLLGHPSVVDFLSRLVDDEQTTFMERLHKETDDLELRWGIEYVQQNPSLVKEGNLLFSLYAARKFLWNTENASQDTFDVMERSFHAHAGWISMYHVLTCKCRMNNYPYARKYLSRGMESLARPEFTEFRESFLAAIGQSIHKDILE